MGTQVIVCGVVAFLFFVLCLYTKKINIIINLQGATYNISSL